MARQSFFAAPAKRLLRIRSESTEGDNPFDLDVAGFLVPPARVGDDNPLNFRPGEIVPPSCALVRGALLLLGEPGSGKSTVFNALVEEIKATCIDGEPAHIIRVDGAGLTELSFKDKIELKLPESAKRSSQESSKDSDSTKIFIVIDQLDESPMLDIFPDRTADLLDTLRINTAKFLIACRTADFPSRLVTVLKSHKIECLLAELAPLTRGQAIELADGVGVDGPAMVLAAAKVGAGVLASIPLTLEMLVRVFQDKGALPKTATETFALGVQYLADEHDYERSSADRITSLDDTVAVASKIAAHLVFTGRRTLWPGREIEASATDLGLRTLSSSIEKTAGGYLQTTTDAIEDAIGTALFTGRDGNRLGFCHSTVAAYLAAKYILEKGATQDQKKSLVLVQTYGPTAAIPPQLRETASWLAALDPKNSDWLAMADPMSLASHSAIVDSPHVRRIIVQSLLDHADEVELTDRDWREVWELNHPELAAQLAPVLSEAASYQPQGDSRMLNARARLALRLAGAWPGDELVQPLVAVALNDNISPYLRSMAMRDAANRAPDYVAPLISPLLSQLEDHEYAKTVDPEDELRGTVLRFLWPKYVGFTKIRNHLLKPPAEHYFGSFYLFLSSIGDDMPQSAVRQALLWAVDVAAPPTHEPGMENVGVDTGVVNFTASNTDKPRLNRYFVESLIERALVGPGFDSRVDALAALIDYSLTTYHSLRMPRGLNSIRRDGKETARSRVLRRKIAWAMLRGIAAEHGHVSLGGLFFLTTTWEETTIRWSQLSDSDDSTGQRRQLINSADFEWLVERWHHADTQSSPSLTDAVGKAASFLFDPSDRQAMELADRQRDTGLWSSLSRWFEPIELDSPIATNGRRAEELRRQRESKSIENRATFMHSVNQLLQAAMDGDSAAFSTLAWNLQSDPDTLSGPVQFKDDVRSFPGWIALGEDDQDLFALAAAHFVATSKDEGDAWLGTNEIHKVAWAGYIALALLERSGLTPDIPSGAWKNWCCAILWFPASESNAADPIKQCLIGKAIENAGESFEIALKRYVARSIDNGSHAYNLVDAFNSKIAKQVKSTLLELINLGQSKIEESGVENCEDSSSAANPKIAIAQEVCETLLDLFADIDELQEIALGVARQNLADPSLAVRICLAPHSAVVLLKHDPPSGWSAIFGLDRDATVDRALIHGISNDRVSLDLSRLNESALEQMYRWADAILPTASEKIPLKPYWVTDDHRSRDWCDGLLSVLAVKGTNEALAILSKLTEEQPQKLNIAAQLIKAQAKASENLWSPPDSKSLAALLSEPDRWLVRSSKELSNAVVDVLDSIRDQLHTHCQLLWDAWPSGTAGQGNLWWRPKPEAALCAYLAHELEIQLAGRGVLVNREVMVRQTNATGAGERTDILVDTRLSPLATWFSSDATDRISVVIEVKCAWNDELREAMRTQLVDRYLAEVNTDCGIYLVGWYPLELWTAPNEGKRQRASQEQPEELLGALTAQAEEIMHEVNRFVRPFLLEIPRPSPAQE